MGKDKKQDKKHGEVKKHWTDIASFSLTAFSVLIGTWAFVKSCNNERDLSEANYKLAAIEHRPMIRFYNPKLTGLTLKLDTISGATANFKNDTIDVKSRLQATIKLSYKNIGNSNAKILGYILTDTITDLPVLKSYDKKRVHDRQTSNDSIFSKHEYQELAVLDSSHITFTHTIQFIDNNSFVIHFIIYYKNELGHQYDTYYWLKGKLNNFGFIQTVDPKTQSPIFILDEKEFWRIVKFAEENNYSSPYDRDQAKENLQYLEKLQDQIN